MTKLPKTIFPDDDRMHSLGRAARGALFLDRDDTLIANREVTAGTQHPGDLFDPALVRLLSGVAEGLRLFVTKRACVPLVVVSNQGGIARGACGREAVEATNRRMCELLLEQGITIDAVYACPYHPKGTVPPFNREHPWRKPGPGMFLAAAEDLGIDLASSWCIGDADRDAQAAISAGIPATRVQIVTDFQGGVRKIV
jgi:D-glycero-D-manno-heptose 1,7-bisphosphate phosphatase